MKTRTKALLALLCAVVLVAATVMVTVAYLKDTDSVENTFTVGKVEITLDEALVNLKGEPVDEDGTVVDLADAPRVKANEYKLIPGGVYTKDPLITVDEESEDCWLFVKVENGLGEDGTINIGSDWALITGSTDTYYYNKVVSAGGTAQVFTQFIFDEEADPEAYKDASITVTAYAVQAAGLDTASAAWSKTFGA